MKEFCFEDLIQDFFINLNNVISTTRSCPIYFQKFPPRILSQYYCHPVKSAANYYYAYWLKLSKKRSVGGNILQKRKKRSKKKTCQRLLEKPSSFFCWPIKSIWRQAVYKVQKYQEKLLNNSSMTSVVEFSVQIYEYRKSSIRSLPLIQVFSIRSRKI